MESICCGTPVITYNCCGSPELLDENSGFVVNENDVFAILEKIEAIKKAKELCEHIINSFNESDKSSISNDWLKITIEKYQNPSKYQEKEIHHTILVLSYILSCMV